MAVMVKTLIEQNKPMTEMMQTQFDKCEIPGPSNRAKRPAELQQQSLKIKVTKLKMVPISRLPLLAAPIGSRSNAGTCTESNNVNVSSNVNPATDVEEMGSDYQEDNNLSCFENELFNEDSSSNVVSVLGLYNDKKFNILEQERNNFWFPPYYILY